ncbi:MAG: pyruvate formate-lyase-activating protein [Bacilli bacterium]
MKGLIDSFDTMGLVDGPGIRFVVFLRTCPLRCLFCHNPEMWNNENSLILSTDELINKVTRYLPFYKEGGITFSGGEPLNQPDFLLDALKQCQKLNIHTALDTSGVYKDIDKLIEILKYTDLVILDIKAIDEENYKKITGLNMNKFNEFAKECIKLNKKLWLRQVIIPGINDSEEYIIKLKEYVKQFKNVQKVELLPYHLYGVEKYKKLNIKYPLENTPPMDLKKLEELNHILNSD